MIVILELSVRALNQKILILISSLKGKYKMALVPISSETIDDDLFEYLQSWDDDSLSDDQATKIREGVGVWNRHMKSDLDEHDTWLLYVKRKDMENALKHADRRELLGREMNRKKLCCPECGNRQVQLLAYIDTKPADWKCRGCSHRFVWEPIRT